MLIHDAAAIDVWHGSSQWFGSNVAVRNKNAYLVLVPYKKSKNIKDSTRAFTITHFKSAITPPNPIIH
jgi:hypothetical protein